MFCPNCGTSISDGAQFCRSCGAKLESIPTAQQTQAPAPASAYSRNAYAQQRQAPAAKRKKGPIIAITAAVAAVLVVIGLGFGLGWFAKIGESLGMGGPVYVLTETRSYDEDGKLVSTQSFELDDRGNVTSMQNKSENNNFTMEYERDNNGYATKQSITNETDDSSQQPAPLEIDNEFNDNGQLTKTTSKQNGSRQTTTFEYYDNGNVKSQSHKTGAFRIRYEFDEFGNQTFYELTATALDETVEMTVKTVWEYDSSNKPTAATRKTAQNGEEEKTTEYDVETDEAGNIVRMTSSDGTHTEYEYAKIDHPSPNARMTASKKLM